MKKLFLIICSIILSNNIICTNTIWQKNLVIGNNVEPLGTTKITKDGNNKIYYIGKSGAIGKLFSIDVTNPFTPVAVCISDLFGSGFQAVALNSHICYVSGRIVYKGNDGFLWNYWFNGTSWQNAKVNTTLLVLDGGISFDEFGRLYYVGIDQKIYQSTLSGTVWTSVPMPTGVLTQNSSDLLYSDGHIFYAGTDNKIYNYFWTGSSWQNAILNNLAPLVAVGSDLSIDEYGRLLCIGNDNKIYQYTNTSPINWSFGSFSNTIADAFCSPKFQINNGRIFYKNKTTNSLSFLHWNNSWNSYNIISTSQDPLLLNSTDFIITNNGDIVYCDLSDKKMYVLTPIVNWKEIIIASGLTATQGYTDSNSVPHCNDPVSDETIITQKKYPVDMQFYYRNSNNIGTVPFEGNVLGFNDITLKVNKTDFNGSVTTNYYTITLNSAGDFITSLNLNAELSEYAFSYKLNGQSQFTKIAEKVVCGDAFLVSGQSNAAGASAVNTIYDDSTPYGKYGRSYGTPQNYHCTNWSYPDNNPDPSGGNCGTSYLGSLILPLQNSIMQNYGIPTCFINGAIGQTDIVDHLLNPTKNQFYFEFSLCNAQGNPDWLFKSITGHILRRVYKAGLENGIKGFIWYQGESEFKNVGLIPSYTTKFQTLYNSIITYIPSIQKTYVIQIHSSPAPNALQQNNFRIFCEEQRNLSNVVPNLKVIPSNGVFYPNCSGVHFSEQGYAGIASRIFNCFKMDFYGAPYDVSNTALDILSASVNLSTNKLSLTFNQPIFYGIGSSSSDSLNNVINAIYLSNGATISSPAINNNVLTFSVSSSSNLTEVAYLGILPCSNNQISPGCISSDPEYSQSTYSYNWWCPSYLRNYNGIASLSFKVPVDSTASLVNDTTTTKENEFETNKVIIYPNPASNIVNVSATETINEIKITDMTGKLLYIISHNDLKYVEINTSYYNKGSYIMSIKTHNQTIYRKLIII